MYILRVYNDYNNRKYRQQILKVMTTVIQLPININTSERQTDRQIPVGNHLLVRLLPAQHNVLLQYNNNHHGV